MIVILIPLRNGRQHKMLSKCILSCIQAYSWPDESRTARCLDTTCGPMRTRSCFTVSLAQHRDAQDKKASLMLGYEIKSISEYKHGLAWKIILWAILYILPQTTMPSLPYVGPSFIFWGLFRSAATWMTSRAATVSRGTICRTHRLVIDLSGLHLALSSAQIRT